MNYIFRSGSIDVTYKCNLNCKHCFNLSGEKSIKKELSQEELISFGSELGSLQLESFCICGGEPVCRLNDVIEFVGVIKRVNPQTKISMVSNGTLWTQGIADSLKNAGLDAIQFSLDGFTDASYDYVRNTNGKLEKVFSAINYASNADLDVMIATLPHKMSYPEFDEIIDFCEDNGIVELRAQPLMPLGRGKENYNHLRLSPDEYESIRRKLKARQNSTQGLRLEWGDPVDHFYMLQEVEYIPMVTVNAYGEFVCSPYIPITIWDYHEGGIAGYIENRIPEKALEHPMLREILSSIHGR